jgi:S1-C subfamily serine protease
MKRKLHAPILALALALSLSAPAPAADDPTTSIIKQNGHTVSLELKFTKKKANSLEQVISFLDWGPNGFATGFIVGDGLVRTSYHVVSGDLSPSKKVQLGFAVNDTLEVKVNVNGCQATVIKFDEAADLALLRSCRSPKQTKAPAFQTSLSKDEKLVLIARPHGGKRVRRGVYYGPYLFRGLEYWSASLDVRDGFSGSPVYNDRAEVIGVFSGYDWSKKLALISPGVRAQKLLEDYASGAKS